MALHMTSRHCPGRRSWLLENDSIDAPMEGERGQVVEPRGIDRSSRPLLGALLTVLQARSAETAARSAAGAAIKQRPSTVSR